MMRGEEEGGRYGITVFKPETPKGVKNRQVTFFVLFCLIIAVQSCYWLFANSAEPFVIGMPFGMFFIVLFVVLEFIALITLYLVEAKELED